MQQQEGKRLMRSGGGEGLKGEHGAAAGGKEVDEESGGGEGLKGEHGAAAGGKEVDEESGGDEGWRRAGTTRRERG